MNNKIIYIAKYDCFIHRILEAISNILESRYLNKRKRLYIKRYNKSYYVSNRRISKLIFNISRIVADEITDLYNKQKNISNLSVYSILYLLNFITIGNINRTCHTNEYNDIYDTLTKIYTFEELYSHLCRFNIQYTFHFQYKFCMLLVILELLNRRQKNIYYQNFITTDYFKNVYVSMKYISYTLYYKYSICINKQFINTFLDLIIINNIHNPILYCYNLLTHDSYIQYIIYIKNNTTTIVFFNILLFYMYKHYINISEIYDYIHSELTNLIHERIILNDTFELYLLTVSSIDNFILYIISNGIVLSSQLSEKLFYNNSYENDIIDVGLKIKLFIDNGIPVKTKCDFEYIPTHIHNKLIDYLIIEYMTQQPFIIFLNNIKSNKIILTDHNIIKLKQFNAELYMKILYI